MNAAMKAMSLGGTVKAEIDKASRFAAGVFGLATQEEVTALRTTIQTLEDTVAILESKTNGAPPRLPDARDVVGRAHSAQDLHFFGDPPL